MFVTEATYREASATVLGTAQLFAHVNKRSYKPLIDKLTGSNGIPTYQSLLLLQWGIMTV